MVGLEVADRPVTAEQRNRSVMAQGASEHPSYSYLPQVVVEVQGGDQHLQGAGGVHRRGRYVLQDGVEQGTHVPWPILQPGQGVSAPRRGVEDGEVELGGVGGQVEEQVLDGANRLLNPGLSTIDLVHDDHRPQPLRQGRLQHVAGLGHRAVHGVHHQQTAVRHVDHPLHLAAEVHVAGGVDDVDLDPFVSDGRVLREDGDAPFPLLGVGVHDQLGHLLVLAKNAAELEHRVN